MEYLRKLKKLNGILGTFKHNRLYRLPNFKKGIIKEYFRIFENLGNEKELSGIFRNIFGIV